MSRHRLAPVLGGLVLCSLLVGGCSRNGPPSRDDAHNKIKNQMIDQGVDPEPAAELADCIISGLYDGEQFTSDERHDVVFTRTADLPDPELVQKVETLQAGCEDEVGVEIPPAAHVQTASDASSTTTDETSTTQG